MSNDKSWKDWTGSGSRSEWKDAFYSFTNDNEKELNIINDIDTSSSWKDLEWDKSREESAKLVIEQEIEQLSEEEQLLYETNAASFWDNFYSKHNNNFFKQRNYLPREFPELIYTQDDINNDNDNKKKIIVEFGCGNGSSFYPLIDLYKHLTPRPFVYGIDFSKSAVDHIRNKEGFDNINSDVLLCDLVNDTLSNIIQDNSIDIGLLLFVLSAIHPSNMLKVLTNIYNALKPGGLLVFRDYGLYDMTQMRFVAKKRRKIEDSFYVRADGTRTYFFSLEFFKELVLQTGFKIEKLKYDTREMKNRKRKLTMYRVWLTAKLRK